MNYSYDEYVVGEGQTEFDITYPSGYHSKSDVTVVRVDPEQSLDFEWVTDTRVNVTSALVTGETIRIFRTVSKINPPVNLQSPNGLTRENITVALNHTLMALQEVLDGRISMVPELMDQLQPLLDQAEQFKDDAEVAAAAAEISRIASGNSATASAGSALAAANSANQAASEAAEAKTSAEEAKLSTLTPFASRAQAEATSIPSSVQYINVAGLKYVRDPSGTALETAGGVKWSPDGYEATPEHWGATGEEYDAAPIFQLMLDWCSVDPNRKIVDTYLGIRYFRTQLNTTGHVVWDARVARYIQAHSGLFLYARGNADPTIVAIDADYVIGSTNLSVALPVIPKRGDWLRIVSNAVNPNDRTRVGQSNKYRIQEWVQAGEGSTSSNVVLIRPLRFVEGMNYDEDTIINAYTTSMNCRVALADSSKVFRFTGGRIEQEGPFAGPVHGIWCESYIGPVISGTNFYQFYGSAIRLTGTVYALVYRCTFGEISDNEVISGQQGYGVSDGGESTVVRECRFSKCRHAYTSLRLSLGHNTPSIFGGGNTVGGLIKDCHSVGCTARHFDTHHGSVDITFEGCTAEAGATGFGGRGIGHIVRGCRSILTLSGFSTLVEWDGLSRTPERYSTEFLVENCVFQSTGEAFNARNSRVTLKDVSFITARHRTFVTRDSHVTIQGNVLVRVSDFNGAIPIPFPSSGNVVVLFLDDLFNAASITVAKSGVFTVDVSALPSLPENLLGPSGGTSIRVFGTLRVGVPDSSELMAVGPNRLIAGPTSEFELILPSTNFTFGVAAGKFAHEYDSDGNTL